jgi:GMP synthase-like glutamine amidotransferase
LTRKSRKGKIHARTLKAILRNKITMKILAIQNCEIEGFGLYEKYFIDHRIKYQIIHAYQNYSFPEQDLFDAIFIGGTPISAYEAHKYPFLLKECEYLRQTIELRKPCFGICCGAQILAMLLGAQVRKCKQKEIGGYEVRLTKAGQSDPLFEQFPGHFPVFHWHGDTFDIPSSAELLVEGDVCKNQLFRWNKVVGLLFHLEMTSHDVIKWAEEYAQELVEIGKNKEQAVEECKIREQEMALLAVQLLDNFFKFIVRTQFS